MNEVVSKNSSLRERSSYTPLTPTPPHPIRHPEPSETNKVNLNLRDSPNAGCCAPGRRAKRKCCQTLARASEGVAWSCRNACRHWEGKRFSYKAKHELKYGAYVDEILGTHQVFTTVQITEKMTKIMALPATKMASVSLGRMIWNTEEKYQWLCFP